MTTRSRTLFGALGLAALVLLPLASSAGADPAKPAQDHAAELRDGQHDFDFYVGTWKVHNRRLKKLFAGSTEWYEFDAISVARPIWGGKGNMDEIEADTPTGHIQGMTIRTYNPQTHLWSLNWTNAKDGQFGAPTVGSFKDGRGEFFDKEVFQGKPIVVRYIWSNISAKTAHWEQAFSTDDGKTWETNWTMDSTRIK